MRLHQGWIKSVLYPSILLDNNVCVLCAMHSVAPFLNHIEIQYFTMKLADLGPTLSSVSILKCQY